MFLVRCKDLKRPPPTLRLNGCNGLIESERIKLISEIETKCLKVAISEKKRKIKSLESGDSLKFIDFKMSYIFKQKKSNQVHGV